VKILLDTTACQGHGRCYEIAPEVFGDDDRGHSELILPEVSGRLANLAAEAGRACPERAITAED
jgi:ferredoxin